MIISKISSTDQVLSNNFYPQTQM